MSNQPNEKSENKPKITPMTSKDIPFMPLTEDKTVEETVPQIEESNDQLELFLTVLPEANALRQKLQGLVKGNQFVKTATADALMYYWAFLQATLPLQCVMNEILDELRVMNGKKPLVTEEKRKVGRPKKE